MRDQINKYFQRLSFTDVTRSFYDTEIFNHLVNINDGMLEKKLKGVFYTYVDGLTRYPGKTNEKFLISFLNAIPDEHVKKSKSLNFFKDYLFDLTEFRSLIGDIKKDTKETLTSKSDAIEDLNVKLKDAYTVFSKKQSASSRIFLGQLNSLNNRSSASECFAEVSKEFDDLIELFGIDTGVLTYFHEVDSKVANMRIEALRIERMANYNNSNLKNGVVISVDDRFFRIYAPQILLYAFHMRELHFHIVFVGSKEMVNSAVKLEKHYNSILADFTGMPQTDNISIHHCELPHWVKNPRTFYACARFFAMPKILKEHEKVYVMDADSYINDNISIMLESFSEDVDISIPCSRGFVSLSPWKRYIANSIFVRNTHTVFEFFSVLNDYLAHGLSEPRSWMLDQNGIAYALEMLPSLKFDDLNNYKRVTRRPMIFSKFEKNINLR